MVEGNNDDSGRSSGMRVLVVIEAVVLEMVVVMVLGGEGCDGDGGGCDGRMDGRQNHSNPLARKFL